MDPAIIAAHRPACPADPTRVLHALRRGAADDWRAAVRDTGAVSRAPACPIVERGGEVNRIRPAGVAVAHARSLQDEGADIIDVGGESTRPGYVPVPAEEEQRRVLPILQGLAQNVTVPISIDTYKASTARLALQAGASIVNDVWGLQRDPDIASVAAEFGAPVIVMHNREEVDPSLDGAKKRVTGCGQLGRVPAQGDAREVFANDPIAALKVPSRN